MHNLHKKISTLCVILIFCTSGVATASLTSFQEPRQSILKHTLLGPVETNETVTLFRHGTDGSITSFTLAIKQKEGQTLGEVLANACNDLLMNDRELEKLTQHLLNDTNISLYKIVSHGKGFHFKMKIRFKVGRGINLFPLLPPYFLGGIGIPLVYCRYPRDVNANTSITPLIGENNETIKIEGNHTIFALGFIGFTSWMGRVSRSPLDIIPRAFAGYTLFVNYNKIS